ncbi:hypothetical protein PM8797T_28364 [Gimesia maris DSM 8797]|nr:hypothetical protein PM8797T_28364 [Gimesia maris DSM 8797]
MRLNQISETFGKDFTFTGLINTDEATDLENELCLLTKAGKVTWRTRVSTMDTVRFFLAFRATSPGIHRSKIDLKSIFILDHPLDLQAVDFRKHYEIRHPLYSVIQEQTSELYRLSACHIIKSAGEPALHANLHSNSKTFNNQHFEKFLKYALALSLESSSDQNSFVSDIRRSFQFLLYFGK